MRHILFILSVVSSSLCFCLEQTKAQTCVEKEFYDCHLSVYGKAELRLEVGQGNIEATVGVVPLNKVGRLRNLKFKNNGFVIKHTGTYLGHYFYSAFTNAPINITSSINVSIAVNGVLQSVLNIVPTSVVSTLSRFAGCEMQPLRLKKGDVVTLNVAAISPSPSVYIRPGADPFLAASLTLFKAETKKK